MWGNIFSLIALVALLLAQNVNAASCPAELKTTSDSTVCSGATSKANCETACCITDTTKCGGVTVDCGDAGYRYDPSKKANAHASKHKANCCSANKKCSAVTCAAGYEAVAANKDTECKELHSACPTWSTCCAEKTGLCKKVTCTANTHHMLYSKMNTVGSTVAACCEEKPLCTAVTCDGNAGYKAASSKPTRCAESTTTYSASITAALCGKMASGCCEKDPLKCVSYTCSKNTEYMANPGTTIGTGDVASKDKNCCLKKSTCKEYYAWTPTTSTSGAVQGIPAVAVVAVIIAVTASSM